MDTSTQDILRVAATGVGATAVMDLWLLALKRAGVPTLNFAFIGRWLGHGLAGRWRHDAIGRAAPVRGELALGWALHYAVGIGFAGLLVALLGRGWMRAPTLLPAVAVGVLTVAAPFFVMQPAMGAGIASSRTPTPWKNRLRSVANHAVFGLGLYLAAQALRQWVR